MKVLIVEDDRALGMFLQKGLQLTGLDTAWLENGEGALEYVETNRVDLVILDLTLPGLDGTAVLKQLAASASGVAVLVLTGRNDVNERVHCLNLGADDFLMKPFSFHELAARCQAILRRQSGTSTTMIGSTNLQMDLLNRRVEHYGQSVELTPKEFSLLECLLRAKGECCTREDLLREVWHTTAGASTNVVDVYINYLRKKLADTGASMARKSNAIETIRGAGYRIVTPTFGAGLASLHVASNLLACGA